eukprot:1161226-Pelagomonas_calceolata.AAC.2
MSISASKLGALYDYLDSGNYKAGLKLANNLLEKNSKSNLVKSLKAYALERTGKTDEAHEVRCMIMACMQFNNACMRQGMHPQALASVYMAFMAHGI